MAMTSALCVPALGLPAAFSPLVALAFGAGFVDFAALVLPDFLISVAGIGSWGGFEAIANDSVLAYYPGQNDLYPPVQQGYDLRARQQSNPYYDRPWAYSVSTAEFDPTVGSRKVPTAISQILSYAPRPVIDRHANYQHMPSVRANS